MTSEISALLTQRPTIVQDPQPNQRVHILAACSPNMSISSNIIPIIFSTFQ
jgi:hypothetical protein